VVEELVSHPRSKVLGMDFFLGFECGEGECSLERGVIFPEWCCGRACIRMWFFGEVIFARHRALCYSRSPHIYCVFF
jgi:hypothetical protein